MIGFLGLFRPLRLLGVYFAGFVLGFPLVGMPVSADAEAQEQARLQITDCAKCHVKQIQEIESRGKKHKTAVTCLDCHQEHPPRGENAIPSCSRCHLPMTKKHFGTENCLACHNPHAPRDLNFSTSAYLAPGCRSCHVEQGKDFDRYPSHHALLDCKECHPVHGQKIPCLECHEPHVKGQVFKDCLRCHKPHKPLNVAYENDIPVNYCAPCHEGPAEVLSKSKTKHGRMLCVYCHKWKHANVPGCRACHFEPHPDLMHEKFPQCLDCHLTPHDPMR